MFDLADFLRLKPKHPPAPPPAARPVVKLLLITGDEDLYTSVRDAAGHCGIEVHRASTVDRALSVLEGFQPGLVIYDWLPEAGDWEAAVDLLAAQPEHPCILLASGIGDKYLWEELVRHGGFDIMPRSATADQLVGCLRFASFSLRLTRPLKDHR
ncbi:MAG TPA: hypothetical protein VG273_03385 [Bryobacteraceae bacterium]|jgi:DNA-binding response OmpR family regulator|nr:hypothetical protein [Bryobacteraceae bacterium]